MNKQALETLINAVILSAVEDYRAALKQYRQNPNNKDAAWNIDSIERFFRSEWFKFLTNINGERLIDDLKKEKGE